MGTEEPQDEGELERHDGWGFSPFTRQAATVVAMVTLVVVGLYFVGQMISLILVLFLGVLFAIFLRGLTYQLASHSKLSETWALVVVVVTLVLLFGGVGWLLAPSLGEQASEIAEMIPESIEQIQGWLEEPTIGQRIQAEFADLDLGAAWGRSAAPWSASAPG